ncbi:MAG: LuxR family two component transcriptional regulator [Bacteroidetes bacterium]|nr:MAG: LuxR family two component transcriptional regulator [Bacteroidota bacterium]
MKKLKLLIADDHQLFLDGLLSLLKTEKSFEPPATATNGNRVLELLQKNNYDICVLDINMPGLNGIETTRRIRHEWPEVKIIILTTYNDKEFISEMLLAGVSGYVLKSATKAELVNAISKAASGGTYYSSEVQNSIMHDYLGKIKKEKGASGKPVVLTKRETEIVKLLAREYTNDRIAEALSISYRTVETHRKNIMQKTGAQNLAGLVKFAYAQGIIS